MEGNTRMSEYLSFWLAKIVVEMAVAGVLIAILFAAWFICAWLKRRAEEK
jgi:hypothetical protein